MADVVHPLPVASTHSASLARLLSALLRRFRLAVCMEGVFLFSELRIRRMAICMTRVCMEGNLLYRNRAYVMYEASIRRMAACMQRNGRGGPDAPRARLTERGNTIIWSYVTDTLDAKNRQQSATTFADERVTKKIRSRQRPLRHAHGTRAVRAKAACQTDQHQQRCTSRTHLSCQAPTGRGRVLGQPVDALDDDHQPVPRNGLTVAQAVRPNPPPPPAPRGARSASNVASASPSRAGATDATAAVHAASADNTTNAQRPRGTHAAAAAAAATTAAAAAHPSCTWSWTVTVVATQHHTGCRRGSR